MINPILLVIVVNFSMIHHLNAQFDCSNESELNEEAKIFCIFNNAATVEQPIQTSENSTGQSVIDVSSTTTATTSKPITVTDPIRTRSGCGLRNVGGLPTESAKTSITAAVSH